VVGPATVRPNTQFNLAHIRTQSNLGQALVKTQREINSHMPTKRVFGRVVAYVAPPKAVIILFGKRFTFS